MCVKGRGGGNLLRKEGGLLSLLQTAEGLRGIGALEEPKIMVVERRGSKAPSFHTGGKKGHKKNWGGEPPKNHLK